MRLVIAIIVLFILALVLAAQTTTNSSQQRTVTKAEIEKLVASANAKLEKLSYREKTTHIYFGDHETSPYSTNTEIFEVLMPNRVRRVSEWKDNQGIRRTEVIDIGNREYLKEEDGPWKILKAKMLFARDIEIFRQATYPEAVYKYDYLYLGEENLNGISADVYQASTREIYRLRGFDIVNLRVGKFWFDKKKRLLKKQFNSTDGKLEFNSTKNIPKDFGQGHINSQQEITEYEYDIPIKIEAPIK